MLLSNRDLWSSKSGDIYIFHSSARDFQSTLQASDNFLSREICLTWFNPVFPKRIWERQHIFLHLISYLHFMEPEFFRTYFEQLPKTLGREKLCWVSSFVGHRGVKKVYTNMKNFFSYKGYTIKYKKCISLSPTPDFIFYSPQGANINTFWYILSETCVCVQIRIS